MIEDKIALIPTLDSCVETQARLMHIEILRELLDKSGEPQLQQKYEILKLFLETADFHKLRAQSEKLFTQNKMVIFNVWVENGESRWEMKALP
jgi:hypothetical protein